MDGKWATLAAINHFPADEKTVEIPRFGDGMGWLIFGFSLGEIFTTL